MDMPSTLIDGSSLDAELDTMVSSDSFISQSPTKIQEVLTKMGGA